MAKTTATVTVGADTRPFERKMKTLGSGLGKTGGALGAGVQRVGGAAMSGLGAGLGFGAAMLGVGSIQGLFNELMAVSPKLTGALRSISVAFQQALIPAAGKLADLLLSNMPAITSGLESFGKMLGDAIQFWTDDAFDPAVWKDIGLAMAEAVRDGIRDLAQLPDDVSSAAGAAARSAAGGGAAGDIAGTAAEALIDLNPLSLMLKYNDAVQGFLFGTSDEGASSL